jgi:hypothetical protein
MKEPQIIMQDASGFHNNTDSKSRMLKGNTYKDASTICIVPTRGLIPARVVQNWMNLMSPMNQKFFRIFVSNMEVGDAYNSAIEMILSNPELSKWKYILTLEEDNMPPTDGLLKLYEGMTEYDVIGGLYWTKGPGGMPMIYGNPKEMPLNFIPQIPQIETIQRCNGLGMGFTLFKMEIFKDKKVPKPWFKTLQENGKAYTQDLYFFENIIKLGYKVACDTRVKVGHYSFEEDIIW